MSVPAPIVAVVEDDEQVRTALDRLLCSAGFQVVAYASGDAFLRHAADRSPNCAVLDLHMPGMSGHEVQDAIVQRNLPIAVVVLTSDDTQVGRTLALEKRVHAYLRKPVDADILIDAIHAAIRSRASSV